MSSTTAEAAVLYTAGDLARLAIAGQRYELIDGKLHAMAPAGGEHGITTKRFEQPLSAYIYEHNLGECFAAETGFTVARDPDTTMAPDWAFIAQDRLPRPIPAGFIPVVPDIVLETRSPGASNHDIMNKVERWLGADVRVVLDLDLARSVLAVHRRDVAPQVLGVGDVLQLDDVLSGFAFPLPRLVC